MIHLTTQQLSTQLDGELNETSAGLAREHLASCAECSSKLAKLEEQEEALLAALRSNPDEVFFDRIARAVESETRPAPRPTTPPDVRLNPARRGRASFPWGAVIIIAAIVASLGAINLGIEYVPRWLSASGNGERLLRAAGGDVPPPNGDALSGPTPDEGTPAEEASATGDAAPEGGTAPPAPIAPAFPTPTRTPPPAASRAPISAAAVGGRMTQSPVEPPASPPAARGKPADPPRAESGSAWTPVLSTAAPPPVAAAPSAARESIDAAADSFILVDSSAAGAVRAAQKLDEEAASNPSVSAYEAAAGGWERSLGLLHGEGYREARLRLADARYRVWQLEPNGERAAMAAAAIRAYLIDAPPGPERGKATRWLLEVEENRYR